MKKIVHTVPGACSWAIIACLVAYMQQTEEHQLRAAERDPTHWIQAIRFGSCPSDGRLKCPLYGPLGDRMRSNCIPVTTLGKRPRPYSLWRRASNGSKPVARITAPTSICSVRATSSWLIALAAH